MNKRRIQGWMLLGITLGGFCGCTTPTWMGGDTEVADEFYPVGRSPAPEPQNSDVVQSTPDLPTSPTLELTSPANGYVPTPLPGEGINPQLLVYLREEPLRTPDENVEIYKGYIDQHGPGSDPLPYHRLAVAKTQAGYYRDAVTYFRYALRLAPKDPLILSDLGYCCYAQNSLGDAEDILRMASELSPSDPRITDKLAYVVALEGRYDEAASMFQQTMSPAAAYEHLAYAAASRGDEEAFRRWYAQATRSPNVFRGPQRPLNSPAPASQNPQLDIYGRSRQTAPSQIPPIDPRQATASNQLPSDVFTQRGPIPGTEPYEAPRRQIPPQQRTVSTPPASIAERTAPDPTLGTRLPEVANSPVPFAPYDDAAAGFARAGEASVPNASNRQAVSVARNPVHSPAAVSPAPAPSQPAPWDRDPSLFTPQPAVVSAIGRTEIPSPSASPVRPERQETVETASVASSDGVQEGRNAFLTYRSGEDDSNPYRSSSPSAPPMVLPSGSNPWARTPDVRDDSTRNLPQPVDPFNVDSRALQATVDVEEASPRQPRTDVSVERYDYEDLVPAPASSPYETIDLSDEINAALTPLMTIIETDANAKAARYQTTGERPSAEFATFPLELDTKLVP